MATKYFSNFPYFTYTLSPQDTSANDICTNIFRRIGFLETLKNTAQAYYPYSIKESDTPEIIAHKFYGSADYYWVVTTFNNIIDPLLDWPKQSQVFLRYIQSVYGSIELAQTTIHHYTKTITKQSSFYDYPTTETFVIDLDTYNSLTSLVPVAYALPSGETISITTTRNIVYAFDYEYDLNEAKRAIKLLKAEYLPQARAELDRLTT